jgi:hypothetical protein
MALTPQQFEQKADAQAAERTIALARQQLETAALNFARAHEIEDPENLLTLRIKPEELFFLKKGVQLVMNKEPNGATERYAQLDELYDKLKAVGA